jgi:hypothetical protein
LRLIVRIWDPGDRSTYPRWTSSKQLRPISELAALRDAYDTFKHVNWGLIPKGLVHLYSTCTISVDSESNLAATSNARFLLILGDHPSF